MTENEIDRSIMQYAEHLAGLSPCLKMKFGAVIVGYNGNFLKTLGEQSILAIGWNHPYTGSVCHPCMRETIPHGTLLERCRAIHAEQDALLDALKKQVSIKGATMYVAGMFPDGKPYFKSARGFYCTFCSRLIHDSGLLGVKVRLTDGTYPLLSIDEIMDSSYEIATGDQVFNWNDTTYGKK